MSKQTIVVIGGTSYIGKSIYDACRQQGVQVIGTKYNSYGEQRELISYDLNTDDIFTVLDSNYLPVVSTTFIICAAITKIDQCFSDKEYSYKTNVVSTIKLLDSLQKFGYKFVYLSSEAVFDGKQGNYTEDDVAQPLNEYGKQKLLVEQHILSKMPGNLVFRLSMVIGRKFTSGHILHDFYQNILSKTPIYSLRGRVFSPTLVDDIVECILQALDKNLSGLYHLANGQAVARTTIAQMLVEKFSSSIVVGEKDYKEFGFKDLRQVHTSFDSSKLKRELNFEFTPIEKVIDDFYWSIKNEKNNFSNR